MNIRRITAPLFAALVGVVAALVIALPASAHSNTKARPARLNVGVQVTHFTAHGSRLSATGLVTAQLNENGQSHQVRTRVSVHAATGGSCTVLYLYLNQLNLQLLGLNAHLDKVQLSLTGNPRAGVLGSLFCKLARAKVQTARVSALHRINNRWAHQRQDIVRFSTAISPRATATSSTSTCQVLSLVVGPLRLQLLGLEVNLNKVTLDVTATRGGGALGDLFCQLADNNPATSTTPTTGTTTTTATTTTAAGTTTT
ncbi:MAG TPA: hypothetical protein VFN48_05385 [Solirubrobacteraceae bacterium]|nr:hypothetical protein [Solirubrobacteraceae bacterium]